MFAVTRKHSILAAAFLANILVVFLVYTTYFADEVS